MVWSSSFTRRVRASGLPRLQVRGTLGFDHVSGHAESDGTVAWTGAALVGVLDGDLVAEEFRRACSGVGDQRFLLRQFQFEVVMQECRQACFDLLGFGLRSGEPERVDHLRTWHIGAAGSRGLGDPRWADSAVAFATAAPRRGRRGSGHA